MLLCPINSNEIVCFGGASTVQYEVQNLNTKTNKVSISGKLDYRVNGYANQCTMIEKDKAVALVWNQEDFHILVVLYSKKNN